MADGAEIRSTILKRDAKGVVRHGAEWLALWSDPDSLKSGAERRADRDAERGRAELGTRLAAAARSLSGSPRLELAFEAHAGSGDPLRVGLDELAEENMPALRGRIDSRALFVRFHDPALHAAAPQAEPAEQRLFDLLEVLRCDALGAEAFPGVGDNLVAFHLDRLRKSDLLGAHLASLVPLAEALRMAIGDALAGRAEPSVPSSGFWMWERWIRQRLSGEVAALVAARHDQRAYAEAARRFITALVEALGGRGDGPVRRAAVNHPGGPGEDSGEESGAGPDEGIEGDGAFEPGADRLADADFGLPHDLLNAAPLRETPPYRAFTTTHDRVARADEVVGVEAMRAARETLERRRGENRRALARLVAQLQRRLMARQTRSWTFDLEEGLIDASRLDRVVVNPGFADAYKQEQDSSFRDTCVTLLIDNSGSMRGKSIELASIAADLIASALEQCGVATEILGFSTQRWKGGLSAKDWARAGSPPDPGRLNDLLHIVYKAADEPLRRARLNLSAMLSPDLLKENVDGEALLWAARRLSARAEARRVLIVISDGAPVDQATLEANSDKAILDRHLREAIAFIERSGQIELAAIGIRHDVETYYRFARRIDNAEELGAALVGVLDAMIVR